MTSPSEVFRIYEQAGPDGYPPEWHRLPNLLLYTGPTPEAGRPGGIKDLVRIQAGERCVRCGHPYAKGAGEWSRCDESCRHGGPVKFWTITTGWGEYDGPDETIAEHVEARWRILTVHHLNGVKLDCRWWNLAALCQRCHLVIQGKVRLERAFIRQHSGWFKPYAAGWYAFKYLGEEISREEAEQRQDELLGLELSELPLF